MEITLDLASLSDVERKGIIDDCVTSKWVVEYQKTPRVHPSRKYSKHFYKFSVFDLLETYRAMKVPV